jgi:hypothetical protein
MSRNRLHMNDTYNDIYNPIFEVLHYKRIKPNQQGFVKQAHSTTQQDEQPITWSKYANK